MERVSHGNPDYYRYLYSDTITETRYSDPFGDEEGGGDGLDCPALYFENSISRFSDFSSNYSTESLITPVSPLIGSRAAGSGSASLTLPSSRYEVRIPPPIWIQEKERRERESEEQWEMQERERGERGGSTSTDDLLKERIGKAQHKRDVSSTTQSSHPSMEEMDMNFGEDHEVSRVETARERKASFKTPPVPKRAAKGPTRTRSWNVLEARARGAPVELRVPKPLKRKQVSRNVTDGRIRSSCTSPGMYLRNPVTNEGLDRLPVLKADIRGSVMKRARVDRRASVRHAHPNVAGKYAFLWFWRILTIFVWWLLFVGYPWWPGAFYGLYRFFRHDHSHVTLGCLIFLFWGTWMAFLPLLFGRFEPDSTVADIEKRDSSTTALVIPAYKAAKELPATLEHALKIFQPKQIFVIGNGRSMTPLDETEDVCGRYGVKHVWVPVGSKIVAEFVGVTLTDEYEYILLIDDDVRLPPDFPLPIDRMQSRGEDTWWRKGIARTACLGYTISSKGSNGTLGTFWQQAQDLEYKLAGMTRCFSGNWGSAIFPHGACVLWDRKVLMSLFGTHPGFAISEDWYFGHITRALGHRIQFCSQVFVETETPASFLNPDKHSGRGGYGEMTVWKQRFFRWNYFHVYRLWDNIVYMFCAWRLGRLELVTKYCVFLEIYDSLTFVARPVILPVALVTNPALSLVILAATTLMYGAVAVLFNAFILGKKKGARVQYSMLPYFFWMKFVLNFVNSASVFYAWWNYGSYFKNKKPKVVENNAALDAARECASRELGYQMKVKGEPPISDGDKRTISDLSRVIQPMKQVRDKIRNDGRTIEERNSTSEMELLEHSR